MKKLSPEEAKAKTWSDTIDEVRIKARATALEEAAKACDAEAALCLADARLDEERSDYWKAREYQAKQDAAAIRSLKEANARP
jgi:hypothetical protein